VIVRISRSLAIAALSAAVLVGGSAGAADGYGPERIATVDEALGVITFSAWWGACGMGPAAADAVATPQGIRVRCGKDRRFELRYRDTPTPRVEDTTLLDTVRLVTVEGGEAEFRVPTALVPYFVHSWKLLAGATSESLDAAATPEAVWAARGRFNKRIGVVFCGPDQVTAMRFSGGDWTALVLPLRTAVRFVCFADDGRSIVTEVPLRPDASPTLKGRWLDGGEFTFVARDGSRMKVWMRPRGEDDAFMADWKALADGAIAAAAADAAAFDAAVEWYRAQSASPEIPESARRYKVRAEAAVREQRYADSAREFADALALAPWWPQGHYNRALVLAEAGRIDEAIAEMGRYLRLVPDATNARQAQDKIYLWEASSKR